MGWRLAESLKKLREQINAAYPNRDKSSDGSIGDTSHSARKSDHNPNAAGVVCAIDIDEDLTPTNTVAGIVAQLQISKDPRIKYIIYEGRITVKGDITRWKPYTGVNPHRHHAHISVNSDPRLADDRREWAIAGALDAQDEPPPVAKTATTPRDLKIGDEGDDVKALQKALGINADGIFGRNTRATVMSYQANRKMKVDGIVGAATRRELDL